MFDIIKGQPVIRTDALTIPELKKIWETAPSEDIAYFKLCYIYHIADPKSPYSKLHAEEREKQVKKDFVKGYVVDKELKEAVDKYIKLNTSVITHSYTSFTNGMAAINRMIDKESKNPTTESVDALIKAMKEMEKFASIHRSLKKAAEEDNEEIGKYKRGVTPSDILTEDDDGDDDW